MNKASLPTQIMSTEDIPICQCDVDNLITSIKCEDIWIWLRRILMEQ